MDYSKYPPDWKTIIVPKILARDGFKCIRCGVAHGSYAYKSLSGTYTSCDKFTHAWAKELNLDVKRVWLQVAHLDHVKSNVSPTNLASFCPTHHGMHDAHHKAMLRITYGACVKDSKTEFLQLKNEKYLDLMPSLKKLIFELTGVKLTSEDLKQIMGLFPL